jgi:cytochrome c-type biogenesis protein CcsB
VSVAVDESMAQLSNNFMYSAMAVYAIGMLSFAGEWAFGSRSRPSRQAAAAPVAAVPAGSAVEVRTAPGPVPPGSDEEARRALAGTRADMLGRIAISLTVLAFGLHLAAVVCRGLSAGRAPWGNMYEFSTASALAVTGAFLFLLTRYDVRWLGVWVLTPVLLTLGLAVTVLYNASGPLVPALHSYWLAIHVTAAVLSTGAFTVGTLVTATFLVADSYERRHGGTTLGRLPAAADLDRLAYRIFAFTFPIWTFALMSGAIWAENAWGRYWDWDPKEVWTFITWVVFAAYLHARATAGWRDRRAAVIALVGYTCLMFNFIGVNVWLTGLHSYA